MTIGSTPRPTAETASALVTALRTGHPDAFALLDASFRPMIQSIARHCGLSWDEADDVVQETLLAAFRAIDGLAEPAALAGWMRTTAKRSAWRIAAKRARQRDRELMVALPTDDELGDDVLREELRRGVAVAVRTLSARDQVVLALTVTADPPIPYVEVAAQLGCPIGSVGPMRGRALVRLAKALRRTPLAAAA